MQSINRDIIIGDVHGCLNELKLLIEKLNLIPGDNIYFIGDVIDRGSDTISTIKFIMNLSLSFSVIMILGNHEEKFLRYIEKSKDLTNDIYNSYKNLLSENEISFLRKSYYNYYIKKFDIMLIHGGFLKKIKISKEVNNMYISRRHQNYSLLTMVRFIDKKGSFIELNKNDENSLFWAEHYKGEYGKVVFGHHVFMQDKPKVYKHAIGIDNGCVFGGWLTALILSDSSNTSSLSVKSYIKL